MAKYKSKIIIVFAVLAILTGTWFIGGNYPGRDGWTTKGPPLSASGPSTEISAAESENSGNAEALPPETSFASGNNVTALPPDESSETKEEPIQEMPVELLKPAETSAPSLTEATETAIPAMDTNPAPTQDKYLTDTIPEGKPKPVEPQDVNTSDSSFFVTLVVRCDMILNNMSALNKEKWELVPEDGVIFPLTTITAYEGESVFNVLQRTMKQAKIHMTFRNTPIYNSAYIEAINNLYEFDVGELSGWMYCVNGWYPNYGSSRYQLKAGDVIEWNYTCNLGRDLGELWIGGRQEDD